MNINGKVVVITGASSGIGLELAYQMAAKGAMVVLAARTLPPMEEAVKIIQQKQGEAVAVQTDVTQKSQLERLVRETVKTFGRVDIFINNAGIAPARGTLLENNEADIRATFETNLMSAVYGTWAAAPEMMKTGGGLLVYVSSVVGKRAVPLSSAYCASKFALQGLTEAIRPELAPKNIRVLTVCPPGVDTAFFKHSGSTRRPRFRLHPVGKIARLIIRACEKESREALLTIDGKILHYGNILAPRLMDWATAKAKGVSQ